MVTGDKKYLDQAKFFLDTRGYTSRKDAYSQAHKPVVEQDEAVGHAVRAVYMYSGMADVAAITGDSSYIKAIDKIWDNIVSKKIYITGGIGARHAGEAFGNNYELPQPVRLLRNLCGYRQCVYELPSLPASWRCQVFRCAGTHFVQWSDIGCITGRRFFFSTPTHCLPAENTVANLGSVVPAALPMSAVSSRRYRDMCMP